MTYVIKIYKKGKVRCLAEIECGEETKRVFDNQLDDDAITMISIGYLRIPRERIDYVIIKEK